MIKTVVVSLIFSFLIPYNIASTGAEVENDVDTSQELTPQQKILEFEIWAAKHGIELVGTNKNNNQLYYEGFDPKTDSVNWHEVPRVLVAANALYKIPEKYLDVMEGKTIYFSTQSGRSYAVLDSFPSYGILVGLNRGIILEQNINEYTVIHEIGHIVDYHGIRGIYGDEKNFFSDIRLIRDKVFQVTGVENPALSIIPGHITKYSSVNDAENFAENFVNYILYPDNYLNRVLDDPLLEEEYAFFKNLPFSYNVN